MADKLAAVGLVPRREIATLKTFFDNHMCKRSDVKPETLTVWGHTRRNQIEFFGPERPLGDITKGDAEEWRLFLVEQGLADRTIRKRCGFTKQFVTFAVKHELIRANPFADLKSAALGNPSRFYFISRHEAQRVMDDCPDTQWRLLFALSRYGGLRCPSEHLRLRWIDINWEHDRITVHRPKTEHHPGGESRDIPIFPELRPNVEQAFDEAEEGTEYFITTCRNPNANLRTRLQRFIRRAGLEP